MEYVRNFLRTNFGVAAVGEGERILLNLFEQRKRMDMQNPLAFRQTIRDCGRQIAANLTYEERLQLLGFLANIARSDNNVCREEIEALKEVATYMGLSEKEVESMLNLGATPWKLPTKFWKFFLQPPMRRCVPPIANWY